MWRGLCFFCLLSAGAWGQPARVTFLANPPVHEVVLEDKTYQPESDGTFLLPIRTGETQISDHLATVRSEEGFAASLSLGSPLEAAVTVPVTYVGFAYFLYRYPALYLLGLLPLGALTIGWRTWRRAHSQVVLLQEQQSAPLLVDPNFPLIGQSLGGYRLEAPLGQGGMATVYRARGPEGGLAAVKVISLESDSSEFRTRFEREIQVSHTLKHANVVEVLDWGQDQQRVYLVLELVDGQSLRDLLPPQGFPLNRALQLSEELCAALQYAHERGVVHRDLKPDNVMITREGKLKLMDFGLARDQKVQTVTLTGQALGTPNYMPPEQFLEKASKVTLDPRSDQYSLAVTVYELLSGLLPLRGESPIAVITKHLYEQPESLLVHKPDLPVALERVLFRALEKEPQNRYANVGEFLQAVRAAVA